MVELPRWFANGEQESSDFTPSSSPPLVLPFFLFWRTTSFICYPFRNGFSQAATSSREIRFSVKHDIYYRVCKKSGYRRSDETESGNFSSKKKKEESANDTVDSFDNITKDTVRYDSRGGQYMHVL